MPSFYNKIFPFLILITGTCRAMESNSELTEHDLQALLESDATIIKEASKQMPQATAEDIFKMTPLMKHAESGNLDQVKSALMDNQTLRDINTQDELDCTALHHSITGKNPAVVGLLITSKADTKIKDAAGQTPLQWARRMGDPAIITLLEKANSDEKENAQKSNAQSQEKTKEDTKKDATTANTSTVHNTPHDRGCLLQAKSSFIEWFGFLNNDEHHTKQTAKSSHHDIQAPSDTSATKHEHLASETKDPQNIASSNATCALSVNKQPGKDAKNSTDEKEAHDYDKKMAQAAEKLNNKKQRHAFKNWQKYTRQAKEDRAKNPPHLALIDAARARDLSVVKNLLEDSFAGKAINQPDDHGKTALEHALTIRNNFEVIKALVDAHAQLPIMLLNDPLLIEIFTWHSDSTDFIPLLRLLLEHGANPNVVNKNGFSPLLSAIGLNKLEMVELLLKHKANPLLNTQPYYDNAIEMAANLKMDQILNLLLSAVKKQNQLHELLENEQSRNALILAYGKRWAQEFRFAKELARYVAPANQLLTYEEQKQKDALDIFSIVHHDAPVSELVTDECKKEQPKTTADNKGIEKQLSSAAQVPKIEKDIKKEKQGAVQAGSKESKTKKLSISKDIDTFNNLLSNFISAWGISLIVDSKERNDFLSLAALWFMMKNGGIFFDYIKERSSFAKFLQQFGNFIIDIKSPNGQMVPYTFRAVLRSIALSLRLISPTSTAVTDDVLIIICEYLHGQAYAHTEEEWQKILEKTNLTDIKKSLTLVQNLALNDSSFQPLVAFLQEAHDLKTKMRKAEIEAQLARETSKNAKKTDATNKAAVDPKKDSHSSTEQQQTKEVAKHDLQPTAHSIKKQPTQNMTANTENKTSNINETFVLTVPGNKETIRFTRDDIRQNRLLRNDLLVLAIINKSKEVVKVLLENNIYRTLINAADQRGLTALAWAAAYGSPDIAKMLLAVDGIKVNTHDYEGATPLIRSIINTPSRNPLAVERHRAVTQLLLAHGADVNTLSFACPPLYYAIRINDPALVQSLVFDHHAKLDVRPNPQDPSKNFLQAAQFAIPYNIIDADCPQNEKEEHNKKIIEILATAYEEQQKKTAPLIVRPSESALFEAVKKCDEQQVARLLQDPLTRKTLDQRDSKGNTALTYGIHNRCAPIVNLLLKYGANPNATDGNGEPMLTIAIEKNEPALVDLLLSYNADIYQKSSGSKLDPVQFATSYATNKDDGWIALAEKNPRKSVYSITECHTQIMLSLGSYDPIFALQRSQQSPDTTTSTQNKSETKKTRIKNLLRAERRRQKRLELAQQKASNT